MSTLPNIDATDPKAIALKRKNENEIIYSWD